jgi:hypothetical protein
LSKPIPARPTTLSRVACLQQVFGYLGGTSNHQGVVIGNDRLERVHVQTGFNIHLNTGSVLKHTDTIFTQIVTDQHLHRIRPQIDG